MKSISLLLLFQLIFCSIFGQSISPAGPISFCAGNSQLLSVTGATIPPTSYIWKRDGVIVGTSATYLASIPGNYTVELDGGGTGNNLGPVSITVKPKPTAAFSFSPNTGCGTMTFTFTDQSSTSTTISAWNWNFGDGQTSTSQNPSHVFNAGAGTAPAIFNVTLIVTNVEGCKDTLIRPITIVRKLNASLTGTGATTFNGQPYFKICSPSDTILTFNNTSTTQSINTSYKIKWGDNSTDFTSATFNTPQTHLYHVGLYSLIFYVYSGSCVDSTKYSVFIGNTPAGGLVSPGGTTICSGTVKPFLISGISNNQPGTSYTLSFNDGTPVQTFNHPAPDSVNHIFNSSSCGNTSSTGIVNFPNSYGAYLSITNPCGTTAGSVVPMYVSDSPIAKITISPKDTVCQGQIVTITNSGNLGNTVENGVCTPGITIWKITPQTPGTPFTILSGNLGNDMGNMDPTTWISGTTSISIRFDSLVNFTIKLVSANIYSCGGIDSTSKTICVNPMPTSSFDIDKSDGCGPLVVNTDNHSILPSCGSNNYQWTVSYTAITGCLPANAAFEYLNGTSAASFNPQIKFINPGVYTLGLTTTVASASCTSALVTKQITVRGKPKVLVSNTPPTLCVGQSFSPTSSSTCYINGLSTYAWTFPGGSPATSISQIPGSITLSTPGNILFTLAATNECGTTIDSNYINITPLPTVSLPADKVLCSGVASAAIPLTGTGSSYSWTNSNSSIGLAANGTGNIPAFNPINIGTTPVTATITVTPLGNLCNGLPTSFTITVNPSPKIQFSLSKQTICSGLPSTAVSLTSTTPGVSFNWTCNAPSGISGAASSGTTSIPAQTLINTTNAPITLQYLATATTGGSTACNGVVFIDTIIVNPSPVVNTIQDQFFCKGSTVPQIAFSGNIPGTIYSWTNSNTTIGLAATGTGNIAPFVATNPGSSDIQATITVTPIYTSGGITCTGTPTSFVLTITPSASIQYSSPNQGICTGSQTVAVNLSSTTSPVSIAWTCTPPSGITGAATSGTTTIPVQTLVNTTNAPITVNYSGTITTTGNSGCTGVPSIYTIVVNPIPTLTQPTNTILCNAVLSSVPAFNASVSGTSFTWTNDNIAIGLPASGTGNIPAFTPINASNTPIFASITVTPRVINAGATCEGQPKSFTLTINPSPSVNQPSSIVVCNGAAINAIPFSGSALVGTTYSWTNNNTAIGLAASGLGDINAFTAINAGNTPLVATISVTPYYSNAGLNCPGPVKTFTITVNPTPVITQPNNQVFCNGSAAAVAPFSGTVAGTNFTWSNDNTAIGLSANGTGNIISFPATNAGLLPITANITVTPDYTNAGQNCVGQAKTFTITVNPTPTVVKPLNQVVCTGSTVGSIALTGSALPGTTYSWTNSNSAIGLAASGSGDINSFVANNTGSLPIVATISVTPTHTSGGISCNGPVQTFTITVNPSPAVQFSGANQTICSGSQTAAIALSSTTPAASIAWTSVTPVGITGAATSGSSSIPVQTLVNTTIAPIVVNFTAIATTTGAAACAGTPSTYAITVNPKPDAIATPSTSSICSNTATNIALSSSISGSTFSWTFSSPASISGAANGLGNTILQTLTNSSTSLATMTYIVTPKFTYNGVGCNGTALNISVTVRPLDAINNSPLTQDMCTGNNSASVVFNSPLNAGATYNWSTTGAIGLSGFTTSGSGNLPAMTITNSGNTTISLVYAVSSTVNLCSGAPTNYTILVHPNARAKFIPTDTIKCPPFAITPAVVGLQPYPLNNGVYQWYVNGTLVGSGTNFPGYSILGEDDSVTVKLKTISQFGCKADSMSRKFYTYKLPHPSFNVVDSVGCGPLTVQMVNTTPNIGFFTYAWNFGNGQTSTLAQPGNIVFAQNPNYTDTVYHVTLTIFSPCDTITVSHDVRVKPKPKALFTPSRTVGCSPMTVTFTNTSLGGNDAYFWDFGDGSTLASNTLSSVQHTYNTGVLDTFYVKLVAVNSCGADSITYALYVSPNNIHLLFAVNGPQHYGCAPHTVAFVNNTSGAISFNWNFGDGNTTTTSANVDTVYHTYLNPGNYTVTLHASNNCTDTSTTDFITVFAKPTAAFIADTYTACQGNPVNFTNQSTGSSSYVWDFGDGTSSTLLNPNHAYALPGLYTVKLTAISTNVPGNVCTDIKQRQVQVVSTLPGSFSISTINSACAPATVTFVNQNRPSVTCIWDFGDGSTGSGDSVTHTYNNVGTYNVSLTVIVPGTCTYISNRVISVNGPTGTLLYTGGFNCYPNAVRLEVIGAGFNTLVWDFGDGNSTTSAQQVIYHTYANTGYYLPKVTMQNAAGCNIQIKGTDSIKVDRRYAGYTATPQQHCNYTTILLQDSTRTFFGTSAVKWTFGDGNIGTGASVSHNYFSSGTYTVQMIRTGNSGCVDTVTKSIVIQVNHLPVGSIVAPSSSCAGKDVSFSAVIQSTDPVNGIQWNISNGVNGSGPLLTYSFPLAGTYTIRLIAGTIYGCLDTSYHTILINPSPVVMASTNTTICLGNSTPLVATGAISYQWSPIQGLSCINCATPTASPILTTPYVVTGTNSFGCTQTASTAVTVIQPFNMNVSNNDTICIGQSANLLATGATRYSWNPAQGLNNTSVSNPVANPILTTSYRVVGYDGFNCFTDTAFVVVAVGQYPIVNLGPDQTLAAGTLFPLNTVVINGPIRNWSWSPTADLSCTTCPLPNAYVRNNTTYMVTVKNIYGCEASDSMQVKVFCQDSQVFVPNAFSPDGDGINDVLMVRGKGIVSVTYFRVFNRWGQLVFERSDFPPNDIAYGWDGKIKGVPSNADVFVYTAAVTCENGSTFVYKGNTSLIK